VACWAELDNSRTQFVDLPWLIGGDFNATLQPEDRLDCLGDVAAGRVFAFFMQKHQIIDPPLSNRLFTWRNATGKVRLDRFLFTSDWDDIFPTAIQTAKPSLISDHNPIILQLSSRMSRPFMFCFEKAWDLETDFPNLVRQT